MKIRIVAWTLLLCLTASVPAFAIFGLPSAEDLLIWLVLRPIVRRNQDTQIANQIQELGKLVTQLQTARNQLTHVRDSTQGLIGAIADPVGDLLATPTDLLSTARTWHSDFTGSAGDMITAITDLGTGTSFSQSWRDVLTAADTIAEPDIRAAYQTLPDGGDAALAAYEKRRERADRRLELAGDPGGCRGGYRTDPGCGPGSARACRWDWWTPIRTREGRIAPRPRSPRGMCSGRWPRSGY